LCELRIPLLIRDLQRFAARFPGVADGPAIDVRIRAKAHDPHSRRAEFECEVSGEIFHGSEGRSNCGRAWHVRSGWTPGDENNDTRLLPAHMPCSCPGSAKSRPNHGHQWDHELLGWEIDCHRAVAVVRSERSGNVDQNIDSACLPNDRIDKASHRGVVKNVERLHDER